MNRRRVLAVVTIAAVGAIGLTGCQQAPDTAAFVGNARLTAKQVAHHINDPHREGQVYEGFWSTGDDGLVIGKAPQHPTMHNLYREEDMLAFLRSAPAT